MASLPGEANINSLFEARDRFVDYVRGRTGDPALAEDIVHDSLVRALKSAPTLRQEDRLLAWFYRILRNTIADEYRRRATVARREQRGVELEEVPDAPPDDERAICECFAALVPTLKPEYADLITALEIGTETPDSAAERLGVTTNNLKVRRHRARQALRRQIELACGLCATEHCRDCTCRKARAERSGEADSPQL